MMLNDVPANTPKVTRGPCKNVLILAKEFEEFFFFLRLESCIDSYKLVRKVLI